jgi:hypothetical protein
VVTVDFLGDKGARSGPCMVSFFQIVFSQLSLGYRRPVTTLQRFPNILDFGEKRIVARDEGTGWLCAS